MQVSKYTYICLRFLFANVIFVKEKFNLSDIFAKINCFGIQRRSKINYVKNQSLAKPSIFMCK